MKTLYSPYINKIRKNKTRLEKALKVKISFSGKTVLIDGNPIEEFLALQVIEAINLGFTVPKALLLKDEDFIFRKINIKSLTRRRDLERIRGRIIGTRGKTKELIENLSDCFVSLHDNTVGIIGRIEDIESATQSIESLIRGKKQGKVYSYLERERSKRKLELKEDLGLKE